ncbi:hypothetical protein ABZ726_28210 [Streptomyces hundungensis]|uniref:hypothetical protein n=1 Tax=Streptomyces hundungensis TaxID=1077946 RepID=UPI00340E9B04
MNEAGAGDAARPVAGRSKRRILTTTTAALGSVLLLVTAWLLLVSMPKALATERDFRAARACPPGVSAPDCLRPVSAVIERTTVRGPKRHTLWLHVKDADGSTPALAFAGKGQESHGELVGKHIGLTYWEGSVRYIDWANAHWYTTEDPRGDYRAFLAWGLALGSGGLGLFAVGLWSVRSPARLPDRPPWQPGAITMTTVALAGLGIGIAWIVPGWRAALSAYGVAAVVAAVAYALTTLLVGRAEAHKARDAAA